MKGKGKTKKDNGRLRMKRTFHERRKDNRTMQQQYNRLCVSAPDPTCPCPRPVLAVSVVAGYAALATSRSRVDARLHKSINGCFKSVRGTFSYSPCLPTVPPCWIYLWGFIALACINLDEETSLGTVWRFTHSVPLLQLLTPTIGERA